MFWTQHKCDEVEFVAPTELQQRKGTIVARNIVPKFLRRLSEDLNATWVRRDEGYSLTREPEKFDQDAGEQTKSESNP